MNKHRHLALAAILAFPAFAAFAAFAADVPVGHANFAFIDSMDYTGWNAGARPMESLWRRSGGTAPLVETNASATASDTFLKFVQPGVITAPLARPVNYGFELTFDALHSRYGQLLWVGLFNTAGTHGYGIAWDSSVATMWESGGFMSIRKFDGFDPAAHPPHTAPGTQLGNLAGPARLPNNKQTAAITGPMATIRLVWSRGGQLRLYVNDVHRHTVTDTAFSDFSRIYIVGAPGSMIDNVTVRIP